MVCFCRFDCFILEYVLVDLFLPADFAFFILEGSLISIHGYDSRRRLGQSAHGWSCAASAASKESWVGTGRPLG